MQTKLSGDTTWSLNSLRRDDSTRSDGQHSPATLEQPSPSRRLPRPRTSFRARPGSRVTAMRATRDRTRHADRGCPNLSPARAAHDRTFALAPLTFVLGNPQWAAGERDGCDRARRAVAMRSAIQGVAPQADRAEPGRKLGRAWWATRKRSRRPFGGSNRRSRQPCCRIGRRHSLPRRSKLVHATHLLAFGLRHHSALA